MACGIPVVASPVGVSGEVVVDGECGFLASTPEQWLDRLARLLGDAELRRRLGEAGRRRARSLYSIHSALPKLVEVLESTADRGRSRKFNNVPGLGKAGGAERDRTANLRVANAALSQLSYGPTRREKSPGRRP